MVSSVMPTYSRVNISFEKGEGVYLYDQKGDKYLDFLSGIAVTALGHGNTSLKKVFMKLLIKFGIHQIYLKYLVRKFLLVS